MPETIRREDNARAYPVSDAQRHYCLDAVKRMQARQKNLRVVTLNIRTLTGKSREIADMMKRRRIDILCIQETRWTGGKSGGKARNIGESYKLYYSGGGKPKNGLAICLSEEWQDKVIETQRKSDRIITMKLVTPEKTFNIVTAYAPQQFCEEDEKQRFWNQLEEVTTNVKETEQLIVVGDLNGHIGRERVEGFERCHGGKSIGRRNEEGDKILDYARSKDLAVVNTFFTQRDGNTYTYKSGLSQTVIDFIMIRRDDLGDVKNCKVIPGEEIALQHILVVMDCKIKKRRRIRRERPKKINWWKLHNEEGDELESKITEMLMEQSMVGDWKWNETYPNILKAAKETLGNEEVQEAVKKKKEAFKRWKRSGLEEDRETLREMNKISKEKCAIVREKGQEQLYKDLEQNGPKRIYKLAKTRQRRAKDHFVKEQGKIVSEDEKIKERWMEYFDRLLNTKNNRKELDHLEPVHGPVPEITEDEVRRQLKKMKNNKARGPDELLIELVKKLGNTGTEWMTSCCREIMKTGIPEEWRIKQNSAPLQTERVIEARLREIVKIKNNQYGFQRGKSTTEPMFCLRMLQEKYREFNKELHMVFVDLEKAYDTIPRELIWYCLRKRQVLEAYIETIKDMYKRSTTSVATNVDVISDDTTEDTPWSMLFADDLVLCDEKREHLEGRLEDWRRILEDVGLKVSRAKTEYLPPIGCIGNIKLREYTGPGNTDLPKCETFKYLGTTIHGGCKTEVELRISQAWNKWRELTGVLCDKKMPKKLKILIYKTVIRPVLLYGNETWPVTDN
ncbi:uncharacterized protein LOC124456042 [Xenia sp. Carnegie-2017]|uniref:uncharacterized protein LOC124456042 n=1 Tax=Xenia sp. Carnegie-2017 TaxID=2897299 RepID=UPI001F046999|nr:uncharacterized protein LOC124456042 [Xenia sp. Carnegie-2017]